MPEKGSEFIHFEYLFFDPDDAETGFSNMVEVVQDPRMAQDKAYLLLGDPRVWALHARRYEQPEQGVHLYDETQHLAKAQNIAYAERKRADTLQKLLGAAVESNHKLETDSRRVEQHDAVVIEALNAVIETLVGQLVMIQGRAQRDQRDCVLMEPGDVFRDAKVNIKALRESEWRKAKLKSRAHVGEKPQSAPEPCVCGHPRERHVDEGPERGCHGCARDEYDHAFKAPEPESAPEDGTGMHGDVCVCSHIRGNHENGTCRACSSDLGTYRRDHEFKLAVL